MAAVSEIDIETIQVPPAEISENTETPPAKKERSPGGSFLTLSAAENAKQFPVDATKNEEKEVIFKLAQEFAGEEIAQKRALLEEANGKSALAAVALAGGVSLLGVSIPEKTSGSNFSRADELKVREIFSTGGSGSFSAAYHSQSTCIEFIYQYGNVEQRAEWLPSLIKGDTHAAYCLAKNDFADKFAPFTIHATLSEDGEFYTLKGKSACVINGNRAEKLLVFARINGQGLTAFFIDKKSKGVQIGKINRQEVLKGVPFVDITFSNVSVPISNQLSMKHKRDSVSETIRAYHYLAWATEMLGAGKQKLNSFLQYSHSTRQFSRPLAEVDEVKGLTGNAVVSIFALESAIYRVGTHLGYYSPDANVQVADYQIESAVAYLMGINFIPQLKRLQLLLGQQDMEAGKAGTFDTNDIAFSSTLYNVKTNNIHYNIIKHILEKTLSGAIPLNGFFQSASEFSYKKAPHFSEPLAAEQRSTNLAKRLVIYVFNLVVLKLGMDLLNRGQLIAALGDLFLTVFALDSVLARTLHLLAHQKDDIRLPLIAKIFCTEQTLTLTAKLEFVVYSLLSGTELEDALKRIDIRKKRMALKHDVFALKRRLAKMTHPQNII